MIRLRIWILFILLSVCLLPFNAVAQSPSLESVDRQIANLQTDDSLTPENRTEIADVLSAARAEIIELERLKTAEAGIRQTVSRQEAIRAEIDAQLAAANQRVQLPDDAASADQLSNALAVLEAEQTALSTRLLQLRTDQTGFTAKTTDIPPRLANINEGADL